MRGVGGVRRLGLLAGGDYTYPRSLTIKLPYVTKNFISYTYTFNLFYSIKNFISNILTIKPPIFKIFNITIFSTFSIFLNISLVNLFHLQFY